MIIAPCGTYRQRHLLIFRGDCGDDLINIQLIAEFSFDYFEFARIVTWRAVYARTGDSGIRNVMVGTGKYHSRSDHGKAEAYFEQIHFVMTFYS